LAHLRVAEHDGAFYLNLADDHCRAVEVAPAAWQIILLRQFAFGDFSGCARAYRANRQAILESVIEADPVATCARLNGYSKSMGRNSLRLLANRRQAAAPKNSYSPPRWPRTPRALAGRLRRAQTSLRALGIEIAFQREGRGGSRMIRIRTLSSASPN
jgi:hypothetical protein